MARPLNIKRKKRKDLINAHPVNIVTVMADLLLISVAASFGQELVDKRFTTQIKKVINDTKGGIPDSPVHDILWIPSVPNLCGRCSACCVDGAVCGVRCSSICSCGISSGVGAIGVLIP